MSTSVIPNEFDPEFIKAKSTPDSANVPCGNCIDRTDEIGAGE